MLSSVQQSLATEGSFDQINFELGSFIIVILQGGHHRLHVASRLVIQNKPLFRYFSLIFKLQNITVHLVSKYGLFFFCQNGNSCAFDLLSVFCYLAQDARVHSILLIYAIFPQLTTYQI